MSKKGNKASILEMARGAITERVDYAMGEIIQNILDPNTDPTKVRGLTLKLKFKPSASREFIQVDCVATPKLQPTTSVQTSLSLQNTFDGSTKFVENTPQIQGQLDFNGEEQEPPKILDFQSHIKRA